MRGWIYWEEVEMGKRKKKIERREPAAACDE